ERGEDDEDREERPEPDLARDLRAAVRGRVPRGVGRGGDRGHRPQSSCLALSARSITSAPTRSTGKRNREMVAPRPSDPATTPCRNAYDASTWVACTGL